MTQQRPAKSLVLYADDDSDDRELVRDAFSDYRESVELKTFTDGVELLAYVRALSLVDSLPCLVILDVNMPKMNGPDVLRALRATPDCADIPVVLFSTSTLPSEKALAKRLDAGFITKPIHAGQIHQLVDQMLDHCAADVREQIKRFRS